MGSDRLSWRRLRVLVEQLPDNSALGRSILGERAGWGISEYLLAQAVDALHGANWQRTANKKIPQPTPVPRPGMATNQRRTQLTPTEMHQRLRRLEHRTARTARRR